MKWFFIGLVFVIMALLMEISSKDKITLQNVAFLQPLYNQCTVEYQRKIDNLVSWHRKYNHPFLVERSVKTKDGHQEEEENDTRFACFIHLGCFEAINMSKWDEFAAIIGVPPLLNQQCVEYIKRPDKASGGLEDMDIIWGLDAVAQKEKIYLEYPQKGLIESFVIQNGQVVQTYNYVKQPLPTSKWFSFMYVRTTAATGEKDSEHMALKTPLATPRGTVYLISRNVKDHTTTLYYRMK
jgi:hypothetical protein